MKTFLLTILLLIGSAFSDGEESSTSSDSTDAGLFSMIMELIGSEDRSWAKPIEYVDMDRMLELMEMGIITFHKAEWYAVIDDE